jgi:hypothetical protein
MNPSSFKPIHPFTATALFVCGGLLIWAADFLVIYVIAAIACARGYATTSIIGIPFVGFIGSVVTLIAVIATAVIVHAAARKWRSHEQGASGFIYFLAATIGAIAIVAMVFNVLPAWLLATECG